MEDVGADDRIVVRFSAHYIHKSNSRSSNLAKYPAIPCLLNPMHRLQF